MTPIKAVALIVIQGVTFGRAKPCLWKKLVGSLLIGILYGCAIEFFRDKHRCFAVTGMQDGKGVIAQGTVSGPMDDQGWFAVGEKLRTSREIRGGVTFASHSP